MRLVPRLALLLLSTLIVPIACGHEVRPALLQITVQPNGVYDVLWKQPTLGSMAVHLLPRISGHLLDQPPTSIQAGADFEVREWRNLDLGLQSLDGKALRIEGLSQTLTDVLLSIEYADGSSTQEILRPESPGTTLRVHGTGIAELAYLRLGVEHILTGADHLAFVFGLFLLIQTRRALLKAITAFTVAHSITLAGTALHLINVRSVLVETLVALSVLCVAVEIVHSYRGQNRWSARYPWLIAFSFGLLHGSAFAGALADVGLPPHAIPLSLVLFNLGVEVGQILFIVTMLSAAWALKQLTPLRMPTWIRWAPAYAIGSSSGVWFIERLSAVFS